MTTVEWGPAGDKVEPGQHHSVNVAAQFEQAGTQLFQIRRLRLTLLLLLLLMLLQNALQNGRCGQNLGAKVKHQIRLKVEALENAVNQNILNGILRNEYD